MREHPMVIISEIAGVTGIAISTLHEISSDLNLCEMPASF
jgi:hypothetical protein